ncbi:putative heterokaryon incompatibility protein [Botrytis fragariae]|uniref:Putative heterokaryon incompatibility protein n=1 Tax=Botrytis fragariae TaxID=1964551 RepID=A0A8H6AMB5_9HELO|nr:putative heterokaryon incompatibility protein [Botrytis fragariae]KAF5869953.1 putative heterokaryon incompatibility protein [Botrytis fragariae]
MSGTFTTCATCEQIIEFSNAGTRQDNVILGTVSSLIDTECPHRRWITKFDPDGAAIQNFSEFKISMFKRASSIVLRSSRDGTGSLGRRFEFVHEKNDGYPNSRRARILDPIWIDEGIILNWKDLCNKHHGAACDDPEKFKRMDAIQPTWLIDTVAGCLVPGREHSRFVTLSYIRGQIVPFYSEKSNIDRLQELGVLSKGSVADKLPMTIKNAIDVVRLIGERYLWVDTLCIVQDDAEALQTEMNSMARIYTTSCITIVATDGIDANYGLRGFKGFTPQRNFKQSVMSMGSPVKLINPRSRNEKHNTLYHSRAWTYQENLFAKRRLFFENGTVYWECSRSSWEEELLPDLPPFKLRSVDPLEPPELFTTSSFPDMKNMNCLLREFNQKVLTFPNDALAAFSGIQWGLSQIFEGGLLYGIPELFFEIGLMWNPIGVGERRHSTEKEILQLPSWSFLGWQVGASFADDGEFEATSWFRAEYLKGVYKPITTWYTMNHSKSTNRRKIASTWYKYKVLAENTTQTPLKGWMRMPFGWNSGYPMHLNTFAYSGDGQEYAYWQSNSPDRWYKYPVPVLDSKKQYPVQLQTQFLYCQTSRAFIHGITDISTIAEKRSSSSSELKDNENFTNIKLQDLNGEVVGFLTLMCERDRAHFTQNATTGALVELVAISQGWFGVNTKSGEEEKEIKDWFPDHTKRQDCYHVLWVEWENGIAYRRGNGCVMKEVWERKREKELVELILG